MDTTDLYVTIGGLVTGVTVALKNYLCLWMKPDDPRYDTTIHALVFVIAFALVVAVRGLPATGSDAVTSLGIAGALLTGGVGLHNLGVSGLNAAAKKSS